MMWYINIVHWMIIVKINHRLHLEKDDKMREYNSARGKIKMSFGA